jgi:hypothetical protein
MQLLPLHISLLPQSPLPLQPQSPAVVQILLELLSVQSVQEPLPVPQASLAVPGCQPVAVQQPPPQGVGSHMAVQAPITQLVPELHTPHVPPFVPQVAALGV